MEDLPENLAQAAAKIIAALGSFHIPSVTFKVAGCGDSSDGSEMIFDHVTEDHLLSKYALT